MGYYLQAIIVESEQVNSIPLDGLPLVKLCSGLSMIPFVNEVLESRNIEELPLTDQGHSELPISICDVCCLISSNGKAIYVEAEYFGGQGTQASAKWDNGRLIGSPYIGAQAINEALKYLGVACKPGLDEFESVGLDKYRNTNEWVGKVV